MLDKWTNMTDVEEEKTVIFLLSSNGQRTETAPVQIFQLIIVSSLLISFLFQDTLVSLLNCDRKE